MTGLKIALIPKSHWLFKATSQTLPIVLGYLPIGFAYGVLALKNGLSPGNTLLMSILVFAGSAQLIAVGLFAAGSGPASVILTSFIVNLRHLLMSASLAPYLKKWSKKEQALFSFQLTDESFALHSMRFARQDLSKPETFSINFIAQAAWIFGTLLGMLAGGLVSDIRLIGLDFTLPAMFIVLLVWQVKNMSRLIAASSAGVMSTLLALLGMEQLNTALATLLGATLGLGIEKWIKD